MHKCSLLTQSHQLGTGNASYSDMRYVQNFTQPDFKAKTFTPSISPNFNSVSENGEIYTAGKTFTLPPAVTGGTNLTSAHTDSTNHCSPLLTQNTASSPLNAQLSQLGLESGKFSLRSRWTWLPLSRH